MGGRAAPAPRRGARGLSLLGEPASYTPRRGLTAYDRRALSATEAADRLESDVLPRLDEILERLDGVDRVAPEDEDQLAADRELIASKRAAVVEQIAALRHAAAR